MTPVEVNDAQIADWRATNYPYKVVAAEIAAWARGKTGARSGRRSEEIASTSNAINRSFVRDKAKGHPKEWP
jgi:hypothetical protein